MTHEHTVGAYSLTKQVWGRTPHWLAVGEPLVEYGDVIHSSEVLSNLTNCQLHKASKQAYLLPHISYQLTHLKSRGLGSKDIMQFR